MESRDWSSDVCSSDLSVQAASNGPILTSTQAGVSPPRTGAPASVVRPTKMARSWSPVPCRPWARSVCPLVPYYFFDRKLGEKFISAANPGSFHPDTSQILQEDILKNYHVGEELKGLRRPVLILRGHQGPMPESVADQTHAIIQGLQLAFLNRCGHFPWLEQPSAFYEQVRSFLEAAQK